MSGPVRFTVELPHPAALALAQFLKRVGWSEMRTCSVDDQECHWIRDALAEVRRALNEAGFDPR